MTNFEMQRQFLETFNPGLVKSSPGFPEQATIDLMLDLIEEELDEIHIAVENRDLLAVFDGLCDLLYVTYQGGNFCGLPLDKGYAEVHRSNMTKLGPDGKPIYREDGKVLKGKDYEPPNLGQFLSE